LFQPILLVSLDNAERVDPDVTASKRECHVERIPVSLGEGISPRLALDIVDIPIRQSVGLMGAPAVAEGDVLDWFPYSREDKTPF
jgi:hypothetical protein